jgi:hypothetical protein
MKKTILFLVMAVALTTQTLFAQVPSYVPTNGLVGYWPFDGNANDESGNGNNGTVNGATLTADRFGNIGKAYSFDGINDYIQTPVSSDNNYSISIWLNANLISQMHIIGNDDEASSGKALVLNSLGGLEIYNCNPNISPNCYGVPGINVLSNLITSTYWTNVVISVNNGNASFYVNGNLVGNGSGVENFGINWQIGAKGNLFTQIPFNGKLDDVGIWNRALTQQEITNLHNSFTSNECLTMVINTGVLSTNPVTYTSSVNIYPNPANDQITIDCGNLANVVGWNIKITNMLGQEVFNQPMNTQQYVVPLNSWTGQGMYFVKIINAQNEVVNIKKIILQ